MSNDPVPYGLTTTPPETAAAVPHDPAHVRAQIGALEAALAQQPDAVFGDSALCPLIHRFAEGIYVREMFMPQGTVLTGKIHRHAHPTFLMQGEVIVVSEAFGRQHLHAPLAFVSPPGTKRAMVALADTVWITVHLNATNTRDLAELEAQLIAPDYAALAGAPTPADDRADYLAVLTDLEMSQAQVRALTDNADDQIQMPHGYAVEIHPSPLDGLGVFVTRAFHGGAVLAPARLGTQRTPVGRYTNHAKAPNCAMQVGPTGIDLVALHALQPGDEATVDYRAARRAAVQYDATLSPVGSDPRDPPTPEHREGLPV